MFDTPIRRATPSQLAFAKAHAERLARLRMPPKQPAPRKLPPKAPPRTPPIAQKPVPATPPAPIPKDAPTVTLTPTASALFTGAQRMHRIIIAVAAAFGLMPRDLTGPGRMHRVTGPRQLAMFLCRERVKASWPAIGRQIGFRDHTTVMHGAQRMERLIQTQAPWAEARDMVTRALEIEETCSGSAKKEKPACSGNAI
jgi:hypothetical protein